MNNNGTVEAVIISGPMKGQVVQLDGDEVSLSKEDERLLKDMLKRLNKNLNRINRSLAKSAEQYRRATARLKEMQ